MLISRKNLQHHWPWIAVLVVGTAAAVIWYFVAAAGERNWPGGSSTPGLAFGFGGGLIILFEFLLWPRKILRRWRVGSARAWMRAHIWLGLLTGPLLVLHSGFQLGGALTTCLVILFGLVIVSGMVGLWLQQWLPKLMLSAMPAETVFSQIGTVSDLFVVEAEGIVQAVCGRGNDEVSVSAINATENRGAGVQVVGAVRRPMRILRERPLLRPVPDSQPLQEAFDRTIRPYLVGARRSGSELRGLDRAIELFEQLRTRLDPRAHPAVDALQECCDQRRQLDRQVRLHRWLHGWLAIHLPLSAALVILMLLHAYFGIWYSVS